MYCKHAGKVSNYWYGCDLLRAKRVMREMRAKRAKRVMRLKRASVCKVSEASVRGLVQVPNTHLAILVRYLQSDQLYYLVLGIAVYMTGIL